jgi:hypothetical protein
MSNKKNIGIVVLIAFVVVLVAIVVPVMNKNKAYSVVYMTTGEVYIGKLSTFPDMQLSDGYIMQVTKNATDSSQNGFQLNPVNQAVWAPQVMHLNKQNIIFYGPLLASSKIAQTLAAK